MPKKTDKKKENRDDETKFELPSLDLHPDIRRSIIILICLSLTIIFILAPAGHAGPWGDSFYTLFEKLFGWGYFFLPATTFLFALSFFAPEYKKLWGLTLLGGVFFILSGLGFIDIIAPGSGGHTGSMIGSLKYPFGTPASLVITFTVLIGSLLITLNRPIKIPKLNFGKNKDQENTSSISLPPSPPEPAAQENVKSEPKKKEGKEEMKTTEISLEAPKMGSGKPTKIKNYVPPPLSLLASSVEKPTIGDLRANANVIKRTLESFGISVEMGEINVGPTVTRYTLKPAEGMKLSRITALHQDLALALAAHPIRIEAPIPGKSLVGIEVPNKSAAVVRLGSLILYPDFEKSGPLSISLGRNVNGEPVFADIAKMPHLLVAGATGSGKSIMIHDLILSLLYKNSPEMLRLILIDPKRVELSVYNALPHLIAPVVIENKKAMGALRWVIHEMDRRYQLLLEKGSRDIKSYNNSADEPLPYLLIVIDELADLMSTYGREVEGSIIRLAQMARATGIHLVVSTQRPSVEVITGLIKANITSRIALQVASQIDSRTILDTSGAEKLLGSGDLLFTSAEKSKPVRIQGAFVTEEEIKKVVSFIAENNDAREMTSISNGTGEQEEELNVSPALFDQMGGEGDDDELYNEAVETVRVAQKASASLLQRRLKVGYARAARLLDLMEERGVVGPGDGAKPREVLL